MGRPLTLPEPWAALAAQLGGVQALADAAGASPRSIHQWAHGTRRPCGPARLLLRRLFEDAGLPVPV